MYDMLYYAEFLMFSKCRRNDRKLVYCMWPYQKKGGSGSRNASMFRFPSKNATKREQWLTAVGLKVADITKHWRICSRHFLNGDSNQIPSIEVGARYCSPKKSERVKRLFMSSPISIPSKRSALSCSITPSVSSGPSCSSENAQQSDPSESDSLTASIGEPLLSDYAVHELPGTSSITHSDSAVLNAGLLARIEFLRVR